MFEGHPQYVIFQRQDDEKEVDVDGISQTEGHKYAHIGKRVVTSGENTEHRRTYILRNSSAIYVSFEFSTWKIKWNQVKINWRFFVSVLNATIGLFSKQCDQKQ